MIRLGSCGRRVERSVHDPQILEGLCGQRVTWSSTRIEGPSDTRPSWTRDRCRRRKVYAIDTAQTSGRVDIERRWPLTHQVTPSRPLLSREIPNVATADRSRTQSINEENVQERRIHGRNHDVDDDRQQSTCVRLLSQVGLERPVKHSQLRCLRLPKI